MKQIDLSNITLDLGAHPGVAHGTCLMEAISVITEDRFSDQPRCVAAPLRDFGIQINDRISQADRNELLKPLIPLLIGTAKHRGWFRKRQDEEHNQKISNFISGRAVFRDGISQPLEPRQAVEILRDAALYAKSLLGPPYQDKLEACSDEFCKQVKAKSKNPNHKSQTGTKLVITV